MNKYVSIGITSAGYEIIKEENEVGGYRYWSDENGLSAVMFDDCLCSVETIEFILADVKKENGIRERTGTEEA